MTLKEIIQDEIMSWIHEHTLLMIPQGTIENLSQRLAAKFTAQDLKSKYIQDLKKPSYYSSFKNVTEIKGFFGEYRFLSNFWPAQIIVSDITFKTVEHAFQYFKTSDTNEKMKIFEAKTPGEAKRIGKTVTLRPDWEDIKVSLMHGLVLRKFKSHKDLAEQLLKTGDVYIEETNDWNDTFWGVCNGQGQNHLGQILMKVRNQLQQITIFTQTTTVKQSENDTKI